MSTATLTRPRGVALQIATEASPAPLLPGSTTMPVLLITPGWGSSGYYSEQVLRAAVESGVFRAGTHMYIDHPGEQEMRDRPERTIRDLAAVLETDAVWDENQGGIVGSAKVVAAWRETFRDKTFTEAIGASIRAIVDSTIGEAEGRKGRIMTEFYAVESVDFVTHAGRGGRILEALESARWPDGDDATEASASDARDQIEQAIAAAFSGDGIRTYILDYDPDKGVVWFAVYDEQGDSRDLYQIGYTSDGTTATLADEQPIEVRRVTTYVPATQASSNEADPTPPPSVPAPAGQSTARESEETNMATIQIEEAELGRLRQDAERVRSLESERDTARQERDAERQEMALLRARESARPSVTAKVGEAGLPAGRKARIVESILAGITVTDGTVDVEKVAAATETAVKEAETELAELAEHIGAGRVHGFGQARESGANVLSIADLDKALRISKEGN